MGLTSGAAAETCLQLVEEAKVVMLGTASGNMGIRSDKSTMAYHVRAGYDDEYRAYARTRVTRAAIESTSSTTALGTPG